MSILKRMALEAIRSNGGEPLDEAGALILLHECIEHIKNEVQKSIDSEPHGFDQYSLKFILDSMTK